MGRHKSLGMKLVISFMGISMIPILLITMFSYYHILNIVNDNNKKLMKYNLSRTKTTLEISVESYQDILVQIYSDDDVVHLINKINRGEDLVVSKNHLRRILRAYLYAKDYIRDLSIITEDGTLVFYDSITGSITRSSWIPNLGIDQKQLYNKYIDENKMFVISTSEAKESLNERNFLFHLGHRIVDYNRRNENIGIIIMSVDEQMLHNICTGDGQDSVAYSFIVDREGKLVSYKDKDLLGSTMINGEKDKKLQYQDFAIQQNIFDRDSVSIDYVHDEKLNWDIVNVSNQHEVLDEIKQQQGITFTIFSFSVAILIVIIAFLTRELTGSIKSVVRIMQSAEEGRRQERVEIDRKMPSEVKVIAHQYNTTMDRLLESVETEKRLDRQKKDAEITALEAQLNPHFLYNTLDSIIWMAEWGKNQEVVRMTSSLAKLLRRSISNEQEVVTVAEEAAYTETYLSIQKMRYKDKLEYEILVDPEIMQEKVIKLILQPLVENAIYHGIKYKEGKGLIRIRGFRKGDQMILLVQDDGKGMDVEALAHIFEKHTRDTRSNGVGLNNVNERIQLYYGEEYGISFQSSPGKGTEAAIRLPFGREEGRDGEL